MKQNDTSEKIDILFNKLDEKREIKEKLFYDGQIYDAYSLLINIIMKAKEKIIIIDNYIDKTILDILIYKNEKVKVAADSCSQYIHIKPPCPSSPFSFYFP